MNAGADTEIACGIGGGLGRAQGSFSNVVLGGALCVKVLVGFDVSRDFETLRYSYPVRRTAKLGAKQTL